MAVILKALFWRSTLVVQKDSCSLHQVLLYTGQNSLDRLRLLYLSNQTNL